MIFKEEKKRMIFRWMIIMKETMNREMTMTVFESLTAVERNRRKQSNKCIDKKFKNLT